MGVFFINDNQKSEKFEKYDFFYCNQNLIQK